MCYLLVIYDLFTTDMEFMSGSCVHDCRLRYTNILFCIITIFFLIHGYVNVSLLVRALGKGDVIDDEV